ncbi:MAG: glycine cleavage system aminomethyltransferase GcvT [Candidatus Sumerlaeota bacterium]
MPKKTALYDKHINAGARMVDFGGWELPVQFEGILAEHRHCRSAAALFDCSHMGQFHIKGPDAAAALSRVCTQDAEALKTGRAKYGYLLNEKGGILDDAILMRLAKDHFHLVVNAGTQDEDYAWIRRKLTGDLKITNLSLNHSWAKIDLQGPESLTILAPLVQDDLALWKFFSVGETQMDGRKVVLSRTGYTGELGYEIMGRADDIIAIFDKIMSDERVQPAGLGARDSLRLEMNYPLYGHELNITTTPLEADGEMFLDLDRDFIGSEALRRQKAKGTDRFLIAYSAETRRRTSPGDEIWIDQRKVGEVTSGVFSPSLETSIGMGYVETTLATPGTSLTVRTKRADIEITVQDKPLYKKGTCRKKVS